MSFPRPDRRLLRRSTRRRLPARDLALVASFAALIAVLGVPGSLYLFGGSVPITLQSMGVMLAASILGARRAVMAVLVLMALLALGLPLLAGGRGGLSVFVAPTAGFLYGFVLGAAVTGWLVQSRLPAYPVWWGALANVLGGMVGVYALGIPVLAVVNDLPLLEAAGASMIFVPGDAIKVALATAVAAAVHRGYPGVTQAAARSRETALTP